MVRNGLFSSFLTLISFPLPSSLLSLSLLHHLFSSLLFVHLYNRPLSLLILTSLFLLSFLPPLLSPFSPLFPLPAASLLLCVPPQLTAGSHLSELPTQFYKPCCTRDGCVSLAASHQRGWRRSTLTAHTVGIRSIVRLLNQSQGVRESGG